MDLQAIHKQLAELGEQIEWQISISNALINKCGEQSARITDLEAAVRSLTDVGDGHYVGWRSLHSFNKYGPFCIYCNAEWDRHTSTPPDNHTHDCPVANAIAVLKGGT